MTSQTINLNLIPGGVAPVINVSQYDKGQTWTFNIYSGSQLFSVPSGANVSIRGTKPDNNGFAYDCTYSGNVVTATEQQQMTAVAGKVAAEIVITKDTEMIGSANFVINVEKAALDSDTPISDTEIPTIIELAESQAEDAEAWAKGTKNGQAVPSTAEQYHNNAKYWAEQASGSAADALKSEGYAVGKQNGTDVASGSPYYHNNSKYYSEQAASSASTASTKASQASTSATNAANSVTAASGSATTASNKALVAEGYADGKQNGTDVASGSPYYHNNSKYYSEQAAASAQSAAQSAASLTVDSALSTSSINPVQNKVITTDLNNVKQALSDEIEARATLGAHNLFNYNAWVGTPVNRGTGVYENNGVTLTASSNDAYTYFETNISGRFPIEAIVPVKEGVPVTLKWDCTETTNMGTIMLFPNGGATGAVSASNTAKKLTYLPISGITYITFRFGVATAGNTVHYKNIMVCNASDPSEKYELYAMTNQQLTENLAGGYVYQSADYISVTGDGTKTVNEVLADAITSFNTFIGTLSNKGVEVTRCEIKNIANAPIQENKILTAAVSSLFFDKSTTELSSGKLEMVTIRCDTTSSNCYANSFKIDTTPSVTKSQYGSNVFANGSYVRIYYKLYNKIV